MRILLLATILAICASPVEAIGPYSSGVNRAMHQGGYRNGAMAYRANLNALGGGYDYSPYRYRSNFGGYGYGAGAYGGYGYYQPWSSFSTPYSTTFNGGTLLPWGYFPYTYSTPTYPAYGFGVY